MPPASKKSTTKMTPIKSSSSPVASSSSTTTTTTKNSPKKLPRKKTNTPTHGDVEEGRQIISRMSDEDVKTLLENLETRCPPFEEKSAASRFGTIKWDQVTPDGFTPDEARKAWSFIRSCERTHRNMHELIMAAQHKFNLKVNTIRRKAILKAPHCPSKPAGLASSFSFYIHNVYAKMTEKDKGPNFNYMEWYRDQGKIYSSLPQEEKDVHIKYFEEQKEIYEQRLGEYYETDVVNSENQQVKLPGIKDTRPKAIKAPAKSELYKDAPQLPLTPLKSFIKTKFDRLEPQPEDEDERQQLEEKYTRKYNELSKSKKVKWIQYVVDELEEYFTNLAEYKIAQPKYNPKPFKITNLLTSDELALWETKNGKPQKPPTSIIDYFRQELESEGQIDSNLSEEEEIKAEAERQWKELNVKDQKTYKLKYDLANVQYSKDLEQYYSSLPECLRPILLPALYKKMNKGSQDTKPKTSKTKTVNGENHIINSPSTTASSSSSAQKTTVQQKKSGKNLKQVQQQKQVTSNEQEEEEEEEETQVLEQEQVVAKTLKKKRKSHAHQNEEENQEDDNWTTMDDEEQTESPKKKKKKKLK